MPSSAASGAIDPPTAEEEKAADSDIKDSSSDTDSDDSSYTASSDDLANHRRGAEAVAKKNKTDAKPGGNDGSAKAAPTETTKNRPSNAIAAIILGAAAVIETKVSRTKKAAAVAATKKLNKTEYDSSNDVKEQTKVDVQDNSGDSTSTEDEDTFEAKSIEVKDDPDDNGNNELKRRISAADAITMSIAEDMILNASKGRKEPTSTPQNTSQSSVLNSSPHPTSQVPPVPPMNPRNSHVGKESFNKMELNYQHQNLAQVDRIRADQLRSTQFPFRLHNMLDDAERQGHAHIVSWCKGGEQFKIHIPTQLIGVLQKYFRQSKFKSFLRQLQGYNFKRITRGKDQGIVSHPLFLRGKRSMATYMKRKRVGPKVDTTVEAEAKKLVIRTAAAAGSGPAKKSAESTNNTANVFGSDPQIKHIPPPPDRTLAQMRSHNNAINPVAQDVLCVHVPNVQHFQGNRKLSSIVKKITNHYKTANESVKTMIVNEISTRLQKGSSRFLKLSEDGLSWVICNREEIFRKVATCFEVEIHSPIDLTSDSSFPNALKSNDSASKKTVTEVGTQSLKSVGTSSGSTRRQEPPSEQDVVLRGGPSSEKEGNTYLITMIQANVGHQVDSFEMKRIKCRAILERMKRRGSRFFLKLNEIEADDEMYLLSDTEAQDVIYTAFCAEEKKIQSLHDTPSASSILHRQALAGMDGLNSGHSSLGGASQFGSAGAVQQSDTALLSRMRAHNDTLASLKRPREAHGHLSNEDIIEKRLRAETDEHVKLLLERAQQRNGPYSASGLANSFVSSNPFNRSHMLESALQSSLYGGAGSQMEQYLKERQADEIILNSAMAQHQFAAGPAADLGGGIPKSNNHFVEFLKKKYNGQERGW